MVFPFVFYQKQTSINRTDKKLLKYTLPTLNGMAENLYSKNMPEYLILIFYIYKTLD